MHSGSLPLSRVLHDRPNGGGFTSVWKLTKQSASAVLRQLNEVIQMNHRQNSYVAGPNATVYGLISRSAKGCASQRGLGQWWMVLTIGIMVGFVFGFIVFLSQLPNDNYTLVETERGIEQIEGADADQYGFYDRLSDTDSLVPNAAADEMPSFERSNSAGKYGAAVNQRPGAVEINDELVAGPEVRPVEIAAAAGGAATTTVTGAVPSPSLTRDPSGIADNRDTVYKKREVPTSTFYYLQAGAFTRADDANRLQRQLVQSGMDAFINKVAIEGKRWHRVRIGPFYDSESLYSAQNQLGRSGVSYLVVQVKKG